MNSEPLNFQLSLDAAECPITTASERIAMAGTVESRGAIFTRSEVVEFMLDLAGYTTDRPLHEMRLLEPASGGGDFLVPIVKRLVAAWRLSGKGDAISQLSEALYAIELHRETFTSTQATIISLLMDEGIDGASAQHLTNQWLAQGDFLLNAIEGEFDFVVGNPPYVRQELISAPLLVEYRRRYSTLYDRADLYVPFIERSLSLLNRNGCLSFICADRWMKNRYGGPLRSFVANGFHLKIYVDMTDTPAFHSEVSAYPAITVLCRGKGGITRTAHRPVIDRTELSSLAADLTQKEKPPIGSSVREMECVAKGTEPWLLDSSDQIALLRRIEAEFPLMEEAGCKVGIGVATGADKAFIGQYDELDVEPDRKLRLATTKDITSGEVEWCGHGVVNPFRDEGGLVDLNDFPRLKRYLEARKEVIAKRHCAKKSPDGWYRTIDRITPSLAATPKLLIPDIKGEAHVVYEGGVLYPHHNLYFVTSERWELRALQAVLLSSISRLFVATYSTKMRGGFLRFQAQYLRRIRLPLWEGIDARLQRELSDAGLARDIARCNQAVFALYKLSKEECSAMGGGK